MYAADRRRNSDGRWKSCRELRARTLSLCLIPFAEVLKLSKPCGWQLPSKISGLYLPVPETYKRFRLHASSNHPRCCNCTAGPYGR